MATIRDLIKKRFIDPILGGSNRIGDDPQVYIKNFVLITANNARGVVKQIGVATKIIGESNNRTTTADLAKKIEAELLNNGIAPTEQEVFVYTKESKLSKNDLAINYSKVLELINGIRNDYAKEHGGQATERSTEGLFADALVEIAATYKTRRNRTYDDREDEEEKKNPELIFMEQRLLKLEEEQKMAQALILRYKEELDKKTKSNGKNDDSPVIFRPSIAMVQSAKSFAGREDEDVQEFVSSMRTFLPGLSGSEEEKTGFVRAQLSGPAKATALRYIADHPDATPEDVLRTLERTYRTRPNTSEKKKIMKSRKRGDSEGLIQYFEEKYKLIADAGITDPAKINHYILAGMGKTIYEKLQDYVDGDTPEELLDRLERNEERTKKMEKEFGSDVNKQIMKNFEEPIALKKIETHNEEKSQSEDIEVKLRKIIQQEFGSIKPRPEPERSTGDTAKPKFPNCRFCGRTNHESIDCFRAPHAKNRGQCPPNPYNNNGRYGNPFNSNPSHNGMAHGSGHGNSDYNNGRYDSPAGNNAGHSSAGYGNPNPNNMRYENPNSGAYSHGGASYHPQNSNMRYGNPNQYSGTHHGGEPGRHGDGRFSNQNNGTSYNGGHTRYGGNGHGYGGAQHGHGSRPSGPEGNRGHPNACTACKGHHGPNECPRRSHEQTKNV